MNIGANTIICYTAVMNIISTAARTSTESFKLWDKDIVFMNNAGTTHVDVH